MMTNKNSDNMLIKLFPALFWIAVWQILSVVVNNNLLIVSPFEVCKNLLSKAVDSIFWSAVVFSSLRIIGGFMTALIFGGFLASLASKLAFVRSLAAPVIVAIKTVPVASFIILILICFPSRNLSFIISFLMVLPIIYMNLLAGLVCVDKSLLEMAQVFNISLARRILYIYLPHLLPYFRSACTVSLGLCWKSGVAAELIGVPVGSVGEGLYHSKIYLDMPELFSWTLVVVILSICFERIFLSVVNFVCERLRRV